MSLAEGGILITKGLVISHLPQKDEVDEDADGSVLVAYDKWTGEKVGEILVDRRLHGPVMSYFMKESSISLSQAGALIRRKWLPCPV